MELVFRSKISNLLAKFKTIYYHYYEEIWRRIDWKSQVSIPSLLQALQEEQGQVRWYAAWVLSQIGSDAEAAVPALIEALKDEDGEIRSLAAKTLLGLGSQIEIPVSVLLNALEDDERYVRRFAIKTLERSAKPNINRDRLIKSTPSTI